ncbi:Putative membrane protein (fragment) [Xenorhabdus doucetiae]|uniref:Putative membrane protein n=1 Tax=Xenorhabdus doucetiae TaxID=351671 RepID=A0A068QY81_9GAMM
MRIQVGNLFVLMGMLGFVFSLFFSFYVDFKLKNESYFLCDKSSWMAPNKYVKDVSLCH